MRDTLFYKHVLKFIKDSLKCKFIKDSLKFKHELIINSGWNIKKHI